MFERIKWRFQFDINTPLYFEREWINTLKSLLASTGYIVNFPCFPSISSFHPVFFCFSSVVVSSQSECGSYHLKMKHTCLRLSLLCAFTVVFCKNMSRRSMSQNVNHTKPAHYLYPLVKYSLVKRNPSILLDISPA